MTSFILGLPPRVAASATLDTETLYNKVGQNTGNLAYQYALFHQLGGNQRIVDWGSNPNQINAMQGIGVIPAANQFGAHVDYTRLAERFSKIEKPLVMVGLGAQSTVEGAVPKVPDGTVDWVREIAKRAGTGAPNIAVRGPFTKHALTHYGLGDSAVVLGCPSLYINPNPALGQTIKKNLRTPNRVAVAAGHLNWKHLQKIEMSLARIVTATGGSYVGQHEKTMITLTRGEAEQLDQSVLKRCRDYICPELTLPEFVRWTRNHGNVFFDVENWMEHYHHFDFVIGARIHGTMLGLQAGIPSMCIVHDSRTLELCRTMKVPYVMADAVSEGVSRADLLSMFDFDADAFDQNRRTLAARYVEFLRNNNLTPSPALINLAAI